jgi:hypothetical protein
MGFSEHIKRVMRKVIISPFFLVFGALVVFSLGLLFGLGYLRYYVDGNTINRRAIDSTLILNLWEEPHFLPGDLNLLKGNQEATISEDGKTMILARMFSRNNTDLFFSNHTETGWSKPVALSGFINTGYEERGPHLSRDGKWLMFQSNRPDTHGGFDLYISQKIGDRWTEPVNLGDGVNSEFDEGFASFSPDGSQIFFSSNRPKSGEKIVGEGPEKKEAGDWDIYRANALVRGLPEVDLLPIYGDSSILENVNTEADEIHVVMPAAGKNLYFSSNRKGGIGGYDIWMSRIFEDAFIHPENLGKPINSDKDEMYPAFADRGTQLIFVSNVYSIHPRALKYYASQSHEVLSLFDYVLLRNVLLIVLLLVIAGVAIHYLLKFLLDSELKLLPRCLIASFLLHLILAALTGSMFITSRIEEQISSNLQEMTVNMNALTRESISVAIRESVSSLPKIQAPSAVEQFEVEVPLKTETPINNRVNPYPDRVSVKETAMASERMTQVRQAPSTIDAAETMQRVAKLNFTNANLTMESPEGVIQSGEGDQLDPSTDPKPVQERMEPRRVVEMDMPIQPVDSIEGTFDDTITEAVQSGSIASASRSQISGNLSNEISKRIKDSLIDEKTLEIASSSPTSIAFEKAYGSIIFDARFTLEVLKEEDEEEETNRFVDFLSASIGRTANDRDFGFDRKLQESNVPSSDGKMGEQYEFEKFKQVTKRDRTGSLSDISDILKANMPNLVMEEDSELEIPEYMLEDSDRKDIRPVF